MPRCTVLHANVIADGGPDPYFSLKCVYEAKPGEAFFNPIYNDALYFIIDPTYTVTQMNQLIVNMIKTDCITQTGLSTTDVDVYAPMLFNSVPFIPSGSNNIAIASAGTAASVGTSQARLTFGTISPVLSINESGAYEVTAVVTYFGSALVVAAGRSSVLSLRRTTGTVGNLRQTSLSLESLAIATNKAWQQTIVYNVSLAAGDVIELQGQISGGSIVGTVTATEATLTAKRLY